MVPYGHDGRIVVGVEHVPDAVRYVPGGHGRGVVDISTRAQVPSSCLTVPNGQEGLAVVVGFEQIPEPVK